MTANCFKPGSIDRETEPMSTGRKVLTTAAAILAMILYLAVTGAAHSNPLATGPMPRCGPLDAAFERLFAELGLHRSWRGFHEDRAGELELAIGRNGAWYLFYLARDRQDRQRVCLIARGHKSQAMFGSPV